MVCANSISVTGSVTVGIARQITIMGFAHTEGHRHPWMNSGMKEILVKSATAIAYVCSGPRVNKEVLFIEVCIS